MATKTGVMNPAPNPAIRCPLPIPFGWFAVARTNTVAPGEIKTMNCFGRQFVLWRGEDNCLRATDPYCRHLGAHLGHGGTVAGNNLQCPFHSWQYDGTGAVVDIPYTSIMPKQLREPCIATWPITEANGLIYAWYHPHKKAPLWQVEVAEEISQGKWQQYEQQDFDIAVHIQEITENGVDYPHFRYIHGTKTLPKPSWKIEGINRLSIAAAKMETPRGIVDGEIRTRSIGPGQSFVRFSGIADILLVNSPTPIEREFTHLRFDFFHPPGIDAGTERTAKALARNIIHQLRQDIPIWENKRYEPEPILCNGDGPILAYRKQYAQYYAPEKKTGTKKSSETKAVGKKPSRKKPSTKKASAHRKSRARK